MTPEQPEVEPDEVDIAGPVLAPYLAEVYERLDLLRRPDGSVPGDPDV